MCTNALNCTHSPLIDGAALLRSTRQILQRVKHGLSDHQNSIEERRSLDLLAASIYMQMSHRDSTESNKMHRGAAY